MTATETQVGHWRRKKRRSETLYAFIRKWHKETDTYPSIEWLRLVFGADYFSADRRQLRQRAETEAR